MGMVEKQIGDNGNNKGLLGMQIGSGGSSIMGSVIFILLIISAGCVCYDTYIYNCKPLFIKLYNCIS